MITQDFLAGDPDSVIIDGLPDLSKFIFIHSSIDDSGLNPYEFRIFCHLRRRSKDRVAWPGMRSISEVTGISIGKVSIAIGSLQKKGFLEVRKRPGNHQSNIYRVALPLEMRPENSVHVVNAEHFNAINLQDSVHHMNTSVHVVNERVSNEGNPSIYSLSSSSSSATQKNKKKENIYRGSPAERTPTHAADADADSLFMNAKKKKHDGQLPLPTIPEALEKASGSRPKGMPSLEMIKTETARRGLPDSDAEYVFNAWMANGFRGKAGQIKSWQHALNNYVNNGWLPSLRRANKFTARDREAEELVRVRQAKQEQEQYDRENGKGTWSTLS
jgi:Helix-turn-helix domain